MLVVTYTSNLLSWGLEMSAKPIKALNAQMLGISWELEFVRDRFSILMCTHHIVKRLERTGE